VEIKIILSPFEVQTAISEYLKVKYGIIQNDVTDIEYQNGSKVDQEVICSGITEITKPYELEF